jgi:hypothetical protein
MIDLDRLTTTVVKFCRFIEELTEAKLQEQPWGPREVLAHLIYWHELCAAQAEAARDGRSSELPEGQFSDLNAVAQNRDESLSEMLRRFREANDRLVSAATASPDIVIQLKRGSKDWPLVELIPNLESHIRNHLRQLEKAQEKHLVAFSAEEV